MYSLNLIRKETFGTANRQVSKKTSKTYTSIGAAYYESISFQLQDNLSTTVIENFIYTR